MKQKEQPELKPEAPRRVEVDRALCEGCGLFEQCDVSFTLTYVPEGWTGRVLCLSGTLGEKDKVPLSIKNPNGKMFRKILKSAGYKKQDFARAVVVRCRPEGEDKPSIKEIRACRPFLLHTINELKPKIVLGLGAIALKSILNENTASIVENRGKLLTMPGLAHKCKIYVTYDPAAVVHGQGYLKEKIRTDLKKMKLPELEHPIIRNPRKALHLGFDTEYSPTSELLTLGISDGSKAISVDQEDSSTKVVEVIKGAEILYGHSVPGDIDYLIGMGAAKKDWINGRKIRDSYLMARMLEENGERGTYGLENLMCTVFKTKPWKKETQIILKKTGDATQLTVAQRKDRCRLDAWATIKLGQAYEPKLLADSPFPDTHPGLLQLTHRIAMTLHRIGLAGAAVHTKKFHKLGKSWLLETKRLGDLVTRKALKLGMKEFVPTNKNHVRKLVYKKMKLPIVFYTRKTKLPAVDKLALEQHKDKKLIRLLLKYGAVQKLASTWYDSKVKNRKSLKDMIVPFPSGLKDKVQKSLLRFWINSLGAVTGRRSSGGKQEDSNKDSRNSQNWGHIARTIIVSRWPHGKVGIVDYRKLEPCILSWIIGDARMLEYFLHGGGYIDIAKDILGKKVKEGTREYTMIKSLILSIHYNSTDYTMARGLWYKNDIHLSENWDKHLRLTTKMKRKYFAEFPLVKEYIKGQLKLLADYQRIVSPAGRIRHLPHDGPNTKGYKHMQNQAVNQPIQSFASDVVGSAMVDFEEALLKEHKISYADWHYALMTNPTRPPASVLYNEVHDELQLDMHPKSGKRDLELLVEMSKKVPTIRKIVPSFDVKLEVKVTVGDSWQ